MRNKFAKIAFMTALAIMTTGLSQAQQTETAQRAVSALHFDSLTAGLELRFEYEDEEERYTGSVSGDRTSKEKRTRFEERFNLEGAGSCYHPNLLEFEFDSSFGLVQEKYREDFKENEDEDVLEYDLTLNFFRQKPINFSLFTNRFSTSIDREFRETIDIETEIYGAMIMYYNSVVPMNLYVSSQENNEDSQDFERDREEDSIEFRANNVFNDVLRTDFTYDYSKITDTVENNRQEVTHHDFSLISVLEYDRLYGTSNVRLNTTSDAVDTDFLQVIEDVRFDHTKTLGTLYHYSFSRFDTDAFTAYVNQGYAGFRHQLYDSLTSELLGEFSDTDEDDYKEFYYGPRMTFSYNKIVPGGTLTAGYNFYYRRTDKETQTGSGRSPGVKKIFGESISFLGGRRAYLRHAGADPDSVVVKDPDGVILRPGIDYRLVQYGSLVEIRRLQIPDNQVVRVDYEYSSSAEIEYRTIYNSFNMRYSFGSLFAVYYRYLRTKHDLISGRLSDEDALGQLTETKVHIYGSEFKWRWLSVTAEHENDSSDIIPLESWRFNSLLQFNLTPSTRLSVSGSYVTTDYRQDRGTVDYESVSAVLSSRLGRAFEAGLEAMYSKEDGRDIDDRVWRVRGDLKGRFRSLELDLEAEYSQRDDIAEDRDELLVKFKLIRYFKIL